MKKVTKMKCPVCGHEFEVTPGRLKNAKYTPVCSRKCLYEGRKQDIIKREVEKPYNVTEEGRKAWREAAKKRIGKLYKPPVKFVCETCGKEVTIPRGKMCPARKLRFCSPKCASIGNSGENNASWRGGHEPYYGPNWQRQRRKARKRDNYACQDCGLTEEEANKHLDIHHKIPFRFFNGNYEKANELSNLVTLCRSCHRKAEAEIQHLE